LPVASARVPREPFPTDDHKLEKVRADLRRALVSMAHVSAETITSEPARAAIKDAIGFIGDALRPLKDLRRILDKFADDAARETLPLRGALHLGVRVESEGERFIDVPTPPAINDTPPLCGCAPHERCTHRRY
jgi:hypothetical protein